jgi:hypothetical protein
MPCDPYGGSCRKPNPNLSPLIEIDAAFGIQFCSFLFLPVTIVFHHVIQMHVLHRGFRNECHLGEDLADIFAKASRRLYEPTR